MKQWLKKQWRATMQPRPDGAATKRSATEQGPQAKRMPASAGPLVLFINLDRDRKRRAHVAAQLEAQGVHATRVAGVHGGSLPRTALAFIPGAAETEAGTLGCFLSHIRAWEMIAASAQHGGIVLEDDIHILRDLGECRDLSVASGCDLVFLNDRMALSAEGTSEGAPIVSLQEVILARTGMDQLASGTDGYYLSRTGAECLLGIVRSAGVWGNVDWFVAGAAIGRSGLTAISGVETFLVRLEKMIAHYGFEQPLITGAALRNPAVRHGGMGSTRLQMNRVARRQRQSA